MVKPVLLAAMFTVGEDIRIRPEIPGPRGWPVVGNGLEALVHGVFPMLQRAWREHGDTFRIQMGPRTLIGAVHPDDVERILISDRDKFFKGTAYDNFRLLVGNGLVTAEGEIWREHRRIAQPSFNKGAVAGLADRMTAATATMLADWDQRLCVGSEFDIHAALLELTMWIIGDTLFGLDLRSAIGTSANAFHVALEELSLRGNEMVRLPLSWPTPANRRLRRALTQLDTTVHGIIAERRASGVVTDDLLGALMAGRDDHGQPLDDQALRDEIITFFLAGHETTALTLSWAWLVLARQPEIQAALCEEADRVLGGRTPTAADFGQLVYTRMFLNEVLRLYTPTWSGARDVIAATQIGGYSVEPGVVMMYLPYFTHRHPEFWPDPERFDPERFTPAASAGRHKCAYLPFSLGVRMCIGNHFSLLEGALILAMIAQRYRFTLSPQARIEPLYQITMRPKYGVRLRVAARRAG